MTIMTSRKKQRGVALVIGMIFLVLLTLLVVSAVNTGSVNLRITSNMQARDEARAVAQQAIEKFVSNYANFYPTPQTYANVDYDINNDGGFEYKVSIPAPVCKGAAHQIPGRSIDCENGVKSGLYCWDTLWEVTATASDTKTGVSQQVTQGFALTFSPVFIPSSAGC
jgi:Tfp pilus assembly protein PilX